MEEKAITLNIRFSLKQDPPFKITLSSSNTISDLKALCVEKTGLEVFEQRMVLKGKIIKNDEETLENLAIKDGDTINLIQIKTNRVDNNINNSLPTNYSTGGHGMLNQMGFSSAPTAQNQMGNNPFLKEMMKSMLQNPQFMQSILENDPTYSRLLQEHPELKGMLSDPTTLSMLNDPQILNSALNMAERSNGLASGAMSGNVSNFPMPGGTNTNVSPNPNVIQPLNNNIPNNINNINNISTVPRQNIFNPMMPFGVGNANPFINQYLTQGNQFNPLGIASAAINFEEKYKEQLKTLEDMGFSDKAMNLEALKATSGNIEAAIERMMNIGN